MTRSVSRIAATTLTVAFVLLTTMPAANAQDTDSPVDERSGPVAYANAAAIALGEDRGAGSVITETQRSPLSPGTSRLAQSRSLLPATDGEAAAVGGNYRVNLGAFGEGTGPYPDGVPSRAHAVTATLRTDDVPVANAETNYAVRDLPSGRTVAAFERAWTIAECGAADELTSRTAADRLWLLDRGGALTPVPLPGPNGDVTRIGLPFGAPNDVPDASPRHTVSDVSVGRVTAYDQLQRQDAWRDGPVTTAAGWRVTIVSHVKDAEGRDLRDVTTTIVLGGVSCSVPAGFTPASARGDAPAVPVKIPAGPTGGATPTPTPTPTPWALGLLGGGLVLGVAALVLARRAPAIRERP